ncbi:MAG: TetR/AcrR family transcriptional regulator [Alphaproteobacteria bacterium]|nr:TetR/AcrR family transcriptional regulator [Alphaproteobacteria bacterium]
MVQVKKKEVRESIVRSALRLFGRQGYAGTSMSAIAKAADVSTANIYVYFGSKLDVLFAIYDPWLRNRIDELDAQFDRERSNDRRLRLLLSTLWQDIPSERNGFANNLVQALSIEGRSGNYNPDLLNWMEGRISRMIAAAVPADRLDAMLGINIAHLIMMAFDGFVINYRLGKRLCTDEMIDTMCRMMMGAAANIGGGKSRRDATDRNSPNRP